MHSLKGTLRCIITPSRPVCAALTPSSPVYAAGSRPQGQFALQDEGLPCIITPSRALCAAGSGRLRGGGMHKRGSGSVFAAGLVVTPPSGRRWPPVCLGPASPALERHCFPALGKRLSMCSGCVATNSQVPCVFAHVGGTAARVCYPSRSGDDGEVRPSRGRSMREGTLG